MQLYHIFVFKLCLKLSVTVKRENQLKAGEKYSDVFCVYGASGQFLGTAVYDKEKKNFKAGKVFFRW